MAPLNCWIMHTVSSRFWAVPARSSGTLCDLTNFTEWILKKMCKNLVLASGLGRIWSPGPFRGKKEDWLTVARSSPSYHQVMFLLPQLQFSRDAFFKKLKPFWNHARLVFWCLDTWEMQSVARCLAWVLHS